MKNNFQIFCLLLLISYIATETCTSTTSPSKAEDCKDETITDADKKSYDYQHCCYREYENFERSKSCIPLTSRQYKNIGKLIKHLDEQNSYGYKIKIDCNSSYIKFYLFSLFLFLI